jgi:hypothetical protein
VFGKADSSDFDNNSGINTCSSSNFLICLKSPVGITVKRCLVKIDLLPVEKVLETG